MGYKTETAVTKYKAAAYGALPNPAGTGYTNVTTYSCVLSTWNRVHLINQSNFVTQGSRINSVTVLSQDANKNVLIGKAYSGDGEKNTTANIPELVTQDDVDSVAAILLGKQDSTTGNVRVPYNFAQEMYDVISLQDKIHTAPITRRIKGSRFVLDNLKHQYYQEFDVGSV